ncbi:hypothetical protein NDN42_01630 [Limosilactobacillus mucosae]|uniref:hypothetical protein n=1 Tax=Limosilactobacillus mucosae TaxID=97478 RepID=UPI0029A69D40|nr:hypothetical protein [Limosilactobacillus mucosae]MDX2310965.1 hypothetical protein [Limosilactobacillus mucosae]
MTKERLIELVNNVKNAFINEIPNEPMSGGQLLTLGYAVVSVVAKGFDMSPNEVCTLMAISFDAEKDENGNYKIQIPREFMGDEENEHA